MLVNCFTKIFKCTDSIIFYSKSFSFKKLIAIWDEEMGCEKNIKVENGSCEKINGEACKRAEITNLIANLLDLQDGLPKPSLLKKYLFVGELFYERSSRIDEMISSYEAHIRRPYYHIKPLDDCELENWHKYLEFMEMQEDLDWVWIFFSLLNLIFCRYLLGFLFSSLKYHYFSMTDDKTL